MQNNLLKQTVEELKKLQLEMHDTLDSGRKAKVEKIIQDLENCQNVKNEDILRRLGNVIGIILRFVILNEGSEILNQFFEYAHKDE